MTEPGYIAVVACHSTRAANGACHQEVHRHREDSANITHGIHA